MTLSEAKKDRQNILNSTLLRAAFERVNTDVLSLSQTNAH